MRLAWRLSAMAGEELLRSTWPEPRPNSKESFVFIPTYHPWGPMVKKSVLRFWRLLARKIHWLNTTNSLLLKRN
jgi:hypothetical protein